MARYKERMTGDALICCECGALVDNALVAEHNGFHDRTRGAVEPLGGGS